VTSIVRDFPLVWSQDPALKRPELPDDATDEQRKAALDEFARAFKVATETGRWESLVKEGQRLTVYRFILPSRTEATWLHSEGSKLAASGIGDLLFRLSLRAIDYGTMFATSQMPKVERVKIDKYLDREIWAVSTEIVDAIDAESKPLDTPLRELGDALFVMLRDRIRPLS